MDLKYVNDLVVTNGDLTLVDGIDETAQRIRDRLSTFKGEWFLDLDYGPDYRNDILIKNPRIPIISAILRAEILKSATGKFTRFDSDLSSDRKLTITYDLNTSEGSVSDEITL